MKKLRLALHLIEMGLGTILGFLYASWVGAVAAWNQFAKTRATLKVDYATAMNEYKGIGQ